MNWYRPSDMRTIKCIFCKTSANILTEADRGWVGLVHRLQQDHHLCMRQLLAPK